MSIRIRQKNGKFYIQPFMDYMTEEQDRRYAEHVHTTVDRVTQEIREDIQHHFDKYGPQRLDGRNWITVIVEEFGETANAYVKGQYEEAIKEAKQTAACLIRMIVEMERERDGLTLLETQWYVQSK